MRLCGTALTARKAVYPKVPAPPSALTAVRKFRRHAEMQYPG